MKIKNCETDGIFVMPKSVIKYLKSAKKAESKLIMYIFANMNGEFDVQKAAEAISESTAVVNAALAFWRGTGIISEIEDGQNNTQTAAKDKPNNNADGEIPPEVHSENSASAAEENANSAVSKPHSVDYDTKDVAEALKNDSEFKQLVNYAEHTLGELLNSSKTASLLYLYDCLGMQCDVIMGIIAHCAEKGKKSLKYIERTAIGIHEDGVVTYKELESYYASKRRYAECENSVKRIIGADRALTKAESKLVNTWANVYRTKNELIEYAYELTVNSISKPSVQYMSKIIEDWYNNGVTDVQTAKSLREKKQAQNENDKKNGDGGLDFDLDDIFERP